MPGKVRRLYESYRCGNRLLNGYNPGNNGKRFLLQVKPGSRGIPLGVKVLPVWRQWMLVSPFGSGSYLSTLLFGAI